MPKAFLTLTSQSCSTYLFLRVYIVLQIIVISFLKCHRTISVRHILNA